MSKRRTPMRATKAVALAAVVWIAIIVVGAGPAADDAFVGTDNIEIVWAVTLLLAVIASVIFLIVMRPDSMEVRRDNKRGQGIWVLVLIFLLLMMWRPDIVRNLIPEQDQTEQVAGAFDPVEEVVDEPSVETVVELRDLLLLGLAVGALGLVAIALRGRRGPTHGLNPALAEQEMHAEVLQSINPMVLQLRETTNPRDGVLAAYAVLEKVLAAHGSARGNAETPTEHVRRSLARLPIDASPFVRLGGLYEVARFSTDDITIAQQRDAVAALEQARRDLADSP